MKYALGKVTFGSFLAKEAYVLQMNIRSLYYIYDSHGYNISTEDQLMICIIKNMIKSHKRMLRQLKKTGEFTGDIKSFKYK